MTKVEKFRGVASDICDLYEKKNKAYGDSFGDTFKKLGIVSAVTRISDKVNRLQNLCVNKDIDNLGENLDDTLRDLAAYAIMTIVELSESQKVEKTGEFCINKGDVFLCTKDIDARDGGIDYIGGRVYLSEEDGCITNEDGLKTRIILEFEAEENFKKLTD